MQDLHRQEKEKEREEGGREGERGERARGRERDVRERKNAVAYDEAIDQVGMALQDRVCPWLESTLLPPAFWTVHFNLPFIFTELLVNP